MSSWLVIITLTPLVVFYPFKYATHPRHRFILARLPAAKPSGHAELLSRSAKPIAKPDCHRRANIPAGPNASRRASLIDPLLA
jgi:hypothetical protein